MKPAIKQWLPQAERCVSICRELYPVKGLIVSPDITRAFDTVRSKFTGLQLHRYPSGSQAEDWVVPSSWEVKEAYLKSQAGEVIASHDEHFLFVAPYSEPVDDWFSKAEIEAHCRTSRTVPDSFALEHRNAYNYRLNDWGITLPYERLRRMSNSEKYHIKIDTHTEPGELLVGEWILPGKRPEIICICSQFDELCNDGQSSAICGALLMEALAKIPDREFTYQLLLVPEMFGTLFYAYNNQETLKRTVAMLNLETLGAGDTWLLKRAFKNGGALEDALRIAFDSLGIAYEESDFFGGFGNDERVYGWPTINIPGPGIQRHPFREYHTAGDSPDILELDKLAEGMSVCYHAISVLEKNFVPEYTQFLQPWLTKHELYTEFWNDFVNHSALNNELLYHIDGETSLVKLTHLTGVPFDKADNFLKLAAEKGIIRRKRCGQSHLRYKTTPSQNQH